MNILILVRFHTWVQSTTSLPAGGFVSAGEAGRATLGE